MKKLIALLLVLCVSAAAMTAYAEEDAEKTYADEHPGVLAFDSYWVSGDAKIRIDADHTDDGCEIVVIEMTGENTFNSWEYLLTYDEETKSLVADGNGMKSSNVFDGTGTITDSRYEYEDGGARFFINDKDQLCWLDEKESTFHTTVFHRIGRFPGRYVYDRAYIAVTWGAPVPASGTVRSWLTENEYGVVSSPTDNGGKLAITNYKTLRKQGRFALVQMNLETGRRNQIRVQMRELGHPLLKDPIYGYRDDNSPLKRLALHAFKLCFHHPVTEKDIKLETPFPQEFTALFEGR